MKVRLIWSLLLVFIFQHSRAETKSSELPALMHSFYGSIEQLKPYMISIEDFKSPKNKESLLGILNDLEKQASQAPQALQASPGFNVTFPLIARHVGEVSQLYKNGIYELAWQRLNATTSLCMSCHTRLPQKLETKAFDWAKRGANIVDPKDLRDAEFYFIAHNYNMALEIFDQAIATHSTPDDNGELIRIYERKIPYLARVRRDPGFAIQNLKSNLRNSKLPPMIQGHIKNWISAFEKWKAEKNDPAKFSDKDLLDYAQKIVKQKSGGKAVSIGDPNVVDLLRTSGLLYERLYGKKDSSLVPEMLLVLAKIERELAPIKYFALGDVYLKECIIQFSSKPVAKQCFQDYSLSIKQRFGPGLPEYLRNSLESLQKMTEGAK